MFVFTLFIVKHILCFWGRKVFSVKFNTESALAVHQLPTRGKFSILAEFLLG